MSPQGSGIILKVYKVYNITFQSFKNNPRLFIPFLIFAIFESIALILLFLYPRMPLRLIFGPPIRTFWGEKFLHYPANFLLLPKLASLSRMGLSVILGSLLTGMAVAIIFDIYNKRIIKLGDSLKSALKKYISLFTVVLILTLLFYLSVKVITISLANYFIGHKRLLFLRPGIWMGPILLFLSFILAIFIQSAFIYAIPILIIEREKIFKSVIKSFYLFKKLFFPTIILVCLPMLIYVPILILKYHTIFLIERIFPEFVLFILFLSIIISSLIIDPLITISTASLYFMDREER